MRPQELPRVTRSRPKVNNMNGKKTGDRRTDRPTDGRTDGPSYRDARTHLKNAFPYDKQTDRRTHPLIARTHLKTHTDPFSYPTSTPFILFSAWVIQLQLDSSRRFLTWASKASRLTPHRRSSPPPSLFRPPISSTPNIGKFGCRQIRETDYSVFDPGLHSLR